MDTILSYSEETVFVALIYLLDNTLKDTLVHLVVKSVCSARD